MTQVARNLTDGVDGFLIGKRYLLLHRDPLFTDEFRGVLATAGVKCLRLPARSPDLNSIVERFVLSIRSECLSKLVPLGESHLRRAVSEYVVHYHRERNHQGVGNRLLTLAEQVVRPAKQQRTGRAPRTAWTHAARSTSGTTPSVAAIVSRGSQCHLLGAMLRRARHARASVW